MKKMLLPDVNFWVSVSFDHHEHHPAAAAFFEKNGDCTFCFCRTTQQGFFRISTNAKPMGKFVRTMSQAWEMYDAVTKDMRVDFAAEPVELESKWRQLTDSSRSSPNMWTDAYLAAFALATDMEIVTFDRGFAQFNLPACTILR